MSCPLWLERVSELILVSNVLFYSSNCAAQVVDDFLAIHGDKWRSVTADSTEAAGLLEPALAKYQVLLVCNKMLPMSCQDLAACVLLFNDVPRAHSCLLGIRYGHRKQVPQTLIVPPYRTPTRRTSSPRFRQTWTRPRWCCTRRSRACSSGARSLTTWSTRARISAWRLRCSTNRPGKRTPVVR